MKYIVIILLLCGCSSSKPTVTYKDYSDSSKVEFVNGNVVVTNVDESE